MKLSLRPLSSADDSAALLLGVTLELLFVVQRRIAKSVWYTRDEALVVVPVTRRCAQRTVHITTALLLQQLLVVQVLLLLVLLRVSRPRLGRDGRVARLGAPSMLRTGLHVVVGRCIVIQPITRRRLAVADAWLLGIWAVRVFLVVHRRRSFDRRRWTTVVRARRTLARRGRSAVGAERWRKVLWFSPFLF